MAAEIVLSLQFKFRNLLLQAENDPGRVPALRRFRSLDSMIKPWCNDHLTPPISFQIRDMLHDLIEALTRSRVFVQERRLKSKNGRFFSFYHSLSRRFFTKGVELQLDAVENKLRELKEKYYDAEDVNQDPLEEMIRGGSLPVEDGFEAIGFESEAKKIEDWLMTLRHEHCVNGGASSGLTCIGIVGMGGCGKTVLAWKVFDGMVARDEFFPRIWVSLSKHLNGKTDLGSVKMSVLREMLEELDDEAVDYGGETERGTSKDVENLLWRLNRGLVGYKYLIVIDGVSGDVDEWYMDLGFELSRGDEFGMDCLARGLPKGSGGAVVVTGRKEVDVRRMVGKKNLFHLKPEKDDCSEIFRQAVSRYGALNDDHPNVVGLMDEISAHCEGFPLVATTLAKIIS